MSVIWVTQFVAVCYGSPGKWTQLACKRSRFLSRLSCRKCSFFSASSLKSSPATPASFEFSVVTVSLSAQYNQVWFSRCHTSTETWIRQVVQGLSRYPMCNTVVTISVSYGRYQPKKRPSGGSLAEMKPWWIIWIMGEKKDGEINDSTYL